MCFAKSHEKHLVIEQLLTMVTKTKYSINYTFSETFKDASSTHQIFMLLALRSCQIMEIRANPHPPPPPLPLLYPMRVIKPRASIIKVKQYDTANQFSEVAALPAQDMLHKEILMCDVQCNNFLKLHWIGSEKLHV